MTIHFVCTGNSYRSRLAEAYLNSKQIDSLKVSSSGTQADENADGPISWVAAWLLKRNGLVPFMSDHWTQTTLKLLNTADKVVFINTDHYEFSQKQLKYEGSNFEVWNVLDIPVGLPDDAAILKRASETFIQIQKKVDDLISASSFKKLS
ncbi:MAG: hypothetical protein ABI758_05855 [Candidatus Woesebacteria bacterium]